MKKAVKLLIYLVGIVIVVIGVFGSYLLWSFSLPAIYENTYYAALVDKVDLLERHKSDKKIILIGGSNVAFGFNSGLLESEFPEYKVINFGLYANLGTKLMMDLAKDYIGAGDKVFLIPETNKQSMSLYFSPVNTWKAIETQMSLYKKLPADNKELMRGNYFAYINEKKSFKEVLPGTGIYQRNNFNEYMDFEYIEEGESLRVQNQMAQRFDPTMLIDYSSALFDYEFFDYANDYNYYVNKQGAKMYFAFCPINALAITNYNEADITNFYWDLRAYLDFPVIGNPFDYHIAANYFFDSNFHLNDAGAILRTRILANDIYRDVLKKEIEASIAIPEVPKFPDVVMGEDSEETKYFNYKENETGYTLTSIKTEYLHLDTIVLPKFLNGKTFNTIGTGCFEHSENLEILVLPKTITVLENGSFKNNHKLMSVKILYDDPTKIQVDYLGGVTEGVLEGFKILVPEHSRLNFMTDYYWSAYSAYFEGY